MAPVFPVHSLSTYDAGAAVPAGESALGIPPSTGGDVSSTGGGIVFDAPGVVVESVDGVEGEVSAGGMAGVSVGGVAGAGVTCSAGAFAGASTGWSGSSEQAASRPSDTAAMAKANGVRRRVCIRSSLLKRGRLGEPARMGFRAVTKPLYL